MINQAKLLEQAHSYFTGKNYVQALFLYSQLCTEYPQNQEYPMYAIFCDIASENYEKGQSLFDYFTIAKNADFENAIKYVNDIINAYNGDMDKMMELMKDISLQSQETLEAINYDDFNNLIKSRGSFRIAFEDIMFSTKVAINSKEQFFDFIGQLIDNNFNTTAYQYLDNYNEFFSYDTKIEEYYKILESKSIDNQS